VKYVDDDRRKRVKREENDKEMSEKENRTREF